MKVEQVGNAWKSAQALGFALAHPKGQRRESCYIDI